MAFPCPATITYIVLSVISLYLQYNSNQKFTTGFFIHIVFSSLWTYMLNYLCTMNMQTTAWLLVMLPYVLGFYIMMVVLEQAVLDPSTLLQYGTPIPTTIVPTTRVPTLAATIIPTATVR